MYSKRRVFVAELRQQNKVIQEKKDNLLKMLGEVKNKKQELEGLTANIQDLKEEYCRKKESKFVVSRLTSKAGWFTVRRIFLAVLHVCVDGRLFRAEPTQRLCSASLKSTKGAWSSFCDYCLA